MNSAIQELIDNRADLVSDDFGVRDKAQNKARKDLATAMGDVDYKYHQIEGIVRYVVNTDRPTLDGAISAAKRAHSAATPEGMKAANQALVAEARAGRRTSKRRFRKRKTQRRKQRRSRQ